MRHRLVRIVVPFAAVFLAASCGDDDGDECSGDSDCPTGSICTPAGVCAPDPGLQRCEADIDCSADAGLDDALICNTTTNRCEAPIVDGCPDQELVDRVCSVSRRDGFCVENVFVNCAGDAAECTECEDGCTPDGCEEPPDAGPDVRDMAPPDEDLGPPDEDMGPEDMGPPDLGPPAPVCGNDAVEDGEECDPPAPPECGELRGCDAECQFVDRVPTCGDDCVDTGEECGETMSGGCGDTAVCRGCLCFVPACDDGFADPGEECGEPSLAACPAGDVCTSGCVCGPPVCGNGDAEPGETCGEPGLDCPAGQACDPEACICLPAPSCGDDTADPGEQCGEPTLAACPATDECLNCVCAALCGNGRVDPDETCGEMGLTCAAGQTCAGCRCISPCGNGTVDPGEECDPANTAPGAPPGAPTCTSSVYCSARCIVEARPRVCGNGCQDLTETCGEPGLPANCGANPCESCHCPNPCGNGVLDEGEACDGTLFSEGCGLTLRGGGRPVLYCTSSCECDFASCRDGFVEGPEQCEWTCPPKSPCTVSQPCSGFDQCNFLSCECEPDVCADGVHDTGEYDTCDTISDPCMPGFFCNGSEDGEIYCDCDPIGPPPVEQ